MHTISQCAQTYSDACSHHWTNKSSSSHWLLLLPPSPPPFPSPSPPQPSSSLLPHLITSWQSVDVFTLHSTDNCQPHSTGNSLSKLPVAAAMAGLNWQLPVTHPCHCCHAAGLPAALCAHQDDTERLAGQGARCRELSGVFRFQFFFHFRFSVLGFCSYPCSYVFAFVHVDLLACWLVQVYVSVPVYEFLN